MHQSPSAGSSVAAIRLSAIVIARDEAHNIGECLASLSFADEIVLVDGGSTDDTVRIAREAGARVVVSEAWHGFGHQKNLALSLASGEWVLSVDADERVPQALAREIEAAIRSNQHAGWMIPRRTQFLGRWIRHCGWTPDLVLRLFRRDSARFSEALVHERVELERGSPGRLSTPLDHYSYPDLASYWRKTSKFAQLWADQQWAAGKRAGVAQALASGFATFARTYLFRGGFLDGSIGFVLCVLLAHGAFIKYVALMDLARLRGEYC